MLILLQHSKEKNKDIKTGVFHPTWVGTRKQNPVAQELCKLQKKCGSGLLAEQFPFKMKHDNAITSTWQSLVTQVSVLLSYISADTIATLQTTAQQGDISSFVKHGTEKTRHTNILKIQSPI